MDTQVIAAPAGSSILSAARAAAAFCLLIMMPAAGAASLAVKLTPGMAHYFDSFDAGQWPWESGQPLNIEEVFENCQRHETVLDRDRKEIVVNQYIRDSKADSAKYRVWSDGSLQKSQ